MEFDTHVVIDSPKDRVFEEWADIEHWADWMPAVEQRVKTTDGPIGLHTSFDSVDKLPWGRVNFVLEVTGYDPPNSISGELCGKASGSWHANFSETEAGTRLDLHVVMDLPGPGKLLSPLVRRMADRDITRDLYTLKDRLEGETDISR